MKKMFFYGAGNNGKKAIELIHKSYSLDYVVDAFIDRYETGEVNGLVIKSLNDIKDFDVRIVITIFDVRIVIETFLILKQKGFNDIWWFMGLNRKIYGKSFFREQCVSCAEWKIPILSQVEMHIMDACNLNCAGCSHFSPIFDRNIPDFHSRINDVALLKKKFAHIIVFYILGGEPLLNPEISMYIKEIRKLLPYTEIVLVTNGLLVPNLASNDLLCIKENDVHVSISEYVPTHQMIERIRNRLEDFEIIYDVRQADAKEKFNKPLSLKRNGVHKFKCISSNCVTIWNGKISRCPTLMYINYFNKFFQQDLPEDGVIDLVSELSSHELLNFLKRRVPLCDYCVENEIDWHVCSTPPTLEDFAVDE